MVFFVLHVEPISFTLDDTESSLDIYMDMNMNEPCQLDIDVWNRHRIEPD